MREYRLLSRTTAQVSQPATAWTALQLVRGATVADVGCGSGAYGYLLRAGWGHTESYLRQGIAVPTSVSGLDVSPRATELARRHQVYDRLEICPATALPLEDDAVGTAVCVETIEHLYVPDVLPALRELVRIASERIIITTPAPEFIVDHSALLAETEAARRDDDFLGRDEYLGLEAALHKSWLDPKRMLTAGFEISGEVVHGSHVYYADPARVDTEALGEIPGVPAPEDPVGPGAEGDWRARYAELLESVGEMARRVPGMVGAGSGEQV